MLVIYKKGIEYALDHVELEQFNQASELIEHYIKGHNPILVFGNGASAIIANHIETDFNKGIRHDTNLRPDVRSLVSNMSMLTALSNDIGYNDVFSEQIAWQDHALVWGISSSGSSPNIVSAFNMAKTMHFQTIAFVGFDGGLVKKDKLADIIVHIDVNNYGISEDCHMILAHAICQRIRTENANNREIVRL